MSHSRLTGKTDLGAALGRLPSGLFVLTVRNAARDTGILASWVQQAGFDPPAVTVAVRRDRFLCDWIGEAGRFTLSQISQGQKHLLRHFAKGFGPDEDAFSGLEVSSSAQGGPILAEALAYLDATVSGHVDSGDHRIFVGTLVGGAIQHPDAEPMIHVRRDGFHY